MNFDKVISFFQASIPAVDVEYAGCDEQQVLNELTNGLDAKLGLPVFYWNQAMGLCQVFYDQEGLAPSIIPIGHEKESKLSSEIATSNPNVCTSRYPKPNPNDVDVVLPFIQGFKQAAIFILSDFNHFIAGGRKEDVFLTRMFKNTLEQLRHSNKRLVLMHQGWQPNEALADLIYPVPYGLPKAQEIHQVINRCLSMAEDFFKSRGKEFKNELADGNYAKLVRAAAGLSLTAIRDSLALSIRKCSAAIEADIQTTLLDFKYDKLKRLGIEYSPPPDVSLGGLHLFREWAQRRGAAFNPEVKDLGIPVPKGILLVGLPGCGKTLISKVLGQMWGIPTLRLNVGDLQSSYVGASEANLRQAIKSIEAMAPVVLVLDEVEKMMAGASGPAGDSGVSQRMFGTLLSWLSERESYVFIVATANDVSSIPPEFTRQGRFDATFFVNLPNHEERVEILKLHAGHRFFSDKTITEKDFEVYAAETEGYSGAELASFVDEAALLAFSEGRPKEVTLIDLFKAKEGIQPLSVRENNKFNELKQWARNAKPTSRTVTSAQEQVKFL